LCTTNTKQVINKLIFKDGAKGFGFTLKGKDDFRLDKFNEHSPCDNFELCYGEGLFNINIKMKLEI
jgi:hypothetical protein